MQNKFLHLAPRILSVAFIIFLSLFALDVFGEYRGFELAIALFMHLIPSFVLALVVVLAWKHDLVGAIVFIFAAVFYVWAAGFGRPWSWYAFISGPAFLVSILFFLNWLYLRKTRTGSRQN